MNEIMNSGTVMWGMGLFWLLVVLLMLMGIAALCKYLFFSQRKWAGPASKSESRHGGPTKCAAIVGVVFDRALPGHIVPPALREHLALRSLSS